jgi:hypothetical protein
MKMKRFLYVFGLLLTLSLFIGHAGWAQPRTETRPPIITNSFAIDKGYYGLIWKIYIEADDPDGNMHKIASVVDQVGYGHYATDWIILKRQYRNHLKGYIQWNTFSSRAAYLKQWTQITLKVSIFDKEGNESNVVVFPFTFQSGVEYKYTLPSPFDQGDLPRLGRITIELTQPDYGDPPGARTP